MKLFHFSDDPNIQSFSPRAVQVPVKRAADMEWLNDPLVWAIDDVHQPLYLFPRECPRILLWFGEKTTSADRLKWFGNIRSRMIAFIETVWLDRFYASCIYRYELPVDTFEDLHDAGMWVSRKEMVPLRFEKLDQLHNELKLQNVELRSVETLNFLKPTWNTSLHVSGIRLRNAQNWA